MARGGGPYNDPNVVRASRSDSNEYSVNQSIDGSIDPVGSQGAGRLANRTLAMESIYVRGTYTRDSEEHLHYHMIRSDNGLVRICCSVAVPSYKHIHKQTSKDTPCVSYTTHPTKKSTALLYIAGHKQKLGSNVQIQSIRMYLGRLLSNAYIIDVWNWRSLGTCVCPTVTITDYIR
jgi:hypothetical protein